MSCSVRFQFLTDPFTKPEMTTNPRTRTLMQVNTLFTRADSFTPKAKSPGEKNGIGQVFHHQQQALRTHRHSSTVFMLCSAQIITPRFFTKPSSSGFTHPEVGWVLRLRHYFCRMWHTTPPRMPMWTHVSLVKCFVNTLKLLPHLKLHTKTQRTHNRWFSMKEYCLRGLGQMQKLWTTLNFP